MISLAGARLLLVCPHPDDETLAAGLLLQEAAARAADLLVVCLTDGENNLIHGQPIDRPALAAESNPFAMHRKRAALDCHASQLLVSRARLEAICMGREAFRPFADDAALAIPPLRGLRRIAHVLFERTSHDATRDARVTSTAIATDEVIA